MAVSNEQVAELLTLVKDQMTLMKEQQERNIAATGPSTTKAKRPDRPVINAGIDDREWTLFLDTWSRYKHMIGATELVTIRMELRAACSADVNKMLFEFVGPEVLNECSEEELLAHIKAIAVKQIHHEVHQMNFHMMSQDEGEPITRFVARLKSQAFLCQFNVRCSCIPPTTEVPNPPTTTVSYADQMVAQRLVAGLRNVDHQRKILSEAGTLTTLEAKVKRLQLLETTEESAVILRGHFQEQPAVAAPQQSKYKKSKRTSKTESSEANDDSAGEGPKCGWCGNTSHPGGNPLTKEFCTAKEKKCNNCHIKGHLAKVCRKSRSAPAAEETSEELIPDIPASASVSFSFAAPEGTPKPSKREDFRLRHRPNKNT